MAAPAFVPRSTVVPTRAYRSPDVVPTSWFAARPGEVVGPQPAGDRLGYQGPDQGYALTLVELIAPRLRVSTGESVADARQAILGVALRRASLFGRAPVIHDVEIAARLWGLLDADPPAELVELRRRHFEGVANTLHHYAEARIVADMVPDATLRMTPQQVAGAFPARWRELLGA